MARINRYSKSAPVIRRMFHAISPAYDFLNHLLSMNIDRRWRADAARIVCTGAKNGRILDVCSGTGDLALAEAEWANESAYRIFVAAADFTPSMTSRAQRKFLAAGQSGIANTPQPMNADTLRLPFADSTFDAVTVGFGIRNVADAGAGLTEMARVCRHGGCVAVLEFSHPKNSVLAALYGLYFRHILPAIGWLITRGNAYRYLVRSVDAFPEGEDFSAMLSQAAGGGRVERHPLTFGIATLYVAEVIKPADTPL